MQTPDEKAVERLASRQHSLNSCHTLSGEASENQQSKKERLVGVQSSAKSADPELADAQVNVDDIAASSSVQNLYEESH